MGDIDKLMRLLHPVSSDQDSSCSKLEWIGLGHGSGVGEWKCRLQPYQYGDLLYGGGSENVDYKLCNCSDFHKCEFYNKEVKE